MTPERWQEIERLYHEARQRDPSERSLFLQRACAADQSLRAEVESLLACRDQAGGFLEAPSRELAAIADVAAQRALDDASASEALTSGFLGRRPWWVWCGSLPFVVAAATLYFLVFARPQPAGWYLKPVKEHGRAVAYAVIGVAAGTAAEKAGFELDDLIPVAEVDRFVREQQRGLSYRFDVLRAGRRQTCTLTLGRKDWTYWGGPEGLRRLAATAASVAYLALAAILFFARPRDRAARWGALLFAQIGFYMLSTAHHVGIAPEASYLFRSLPLPLGVLTLLAFSLCATMPAGLFGFCAVFPRPLPLSTHRWWPWWLVLVALVATTGVDLSAVWLPVYAGPDRPDVPRLVLAQGMVLGIVFLGWALALFVRSYRRIERPSERRRLRLVAAGIAISVSALIISIVLMIGTLESGGSGQPWPAFEQVQERSFWQAMRLVLLSAAALCMAYAILRQRVFDIRVIVRLGLRYAAARGVLLSVVPAAALVLGLDVLVHRSQSVSEIVAQRGLLYLALGAGAVILHVKRKTWMDALDRRFFRERYDAYRLLGGVTDDVRRSASFDEAARHVITRIDDALHPESVSLMVRKPDDTAYRSVASASDPPPPIPAGARLVGLMRLLSKPLENSQSGTGWLQQRLPRTEVALLRHARAEWLFPVSLRQTGTEAFLLLGPKRSEEPYSREDRELLEAVTASLGLLLDRTSPVGFAECSSCGRCYDPGSIRCAEDEGTLIKSPYSRTIAGRYRFDRCLGRGGMGVVYEAFDTELKRQVAVKMIRPDLMASPGAVARFRREARTAARLSHPNVVSVYDFGVADDDRAYLVMELLKGRTLREDLRGRGRLDSARALAILRGVSAAVELAHGCGLIHRDLKPENIFLVQSDAEEGAKILDFGLVKPLNPGATDTLSGTLPGALVGTPAYMSPEQLRHETPAESWDVWALAVIAFEVLTGTYPFVFVGNRRSALASLDCIPTGDPPATLPPAAREFFERAFAPDRARRPASARQLIDELEVVLQHLA